MPCFSKVSFPFFETVIFKHEKHHDVHNLRRYYYFGASNIVKKIMYKINISKIENELIDIIGVAITHNDVLMIKYLLKQGVSINKTFTHNYTMLIEASDRRHLNLVEFLVKNGANVNHIDNKGCNALNWVFNTHGYTLLVEATPECTKIINILLDNGAKIFIGYDTYGFTTLGYASRIPFYHKLLLNRVKKRKYEYAQFCKTQLMNAIISVPTVLVNLIVNDYMVHDKYF